MKFLALFVFICLFSTSLVANTSAQSKKMIANDIPGFQLLPSTFTVYVNNGTISTDQSVGSLVAHLPVNNDMMVNPGCYIACYRHDQGEYLVGNNIYAVGLVQVWGTYNLETNICQPHTARGKDVSTLPEFSGYCNRMFAGCENEQCWAGGDTGSWFKFHKIKRMKIPEGPRMTREEGLKTSLAPTSLTQTSLFDPTADQTLVSRRVQ